MQKPPQQTKQTNNNRARCKNEAVCECALGGTANEILTALDMKGSGMTHTLADVDVGKPFLGKLLPCVFVPPACDTGGDVSKISPTKRSSLTATGVKVQGGQGDADGEDEVNNTSKTTRALRLVSRKRAGKRTHLNDLLWREIWAKVWSICKHKLAVLVSFGQWPCFIFFIHRCCDKGASAFLPDLFP